MEEGEGNGEEEEEKEGRENIVLQKPRALLVQGVTNPITGGSQVS
jgi:hypothetical protein